MDKHIYVQRHCVSEWLARIKAIENVTRELEPRIQEIRARLVGMGYDPSKEGRGGASGGVSEGIATLLELEEDWNHRVATYSREYEHAKDLCSSLHPDCKLVWRHYVEGEKWEDIAEDEGYSRRQTLRKAEDGIRELYIHVPEHVKREAFPNALG